VSGAAGIPAGHGGEEVNKNRLTRGEFTAATELSQLVTGAFWR
jgi:hypothetical protein